MLANGVLLVSKILLVYEEALWPKMLKICHASQILTNDFGSFLSYLITTVNATNIVLKKKYHEKVKLSESCFLIGQNYSLDGFSGSHKSIFCSKKWNLKCNFRKKWSHCEMQFCSQIYS